MFALLAHCFQFYYCRIQTGKLSEFLTTSCFAHLSFLDSGKTRSSNKGWNEDDDDGYFAGAVHDLNFNDGKRNNRVFCGLVK